jgi:DNA-3-methyladenine glycosylase II
VRIEQCEIPISGPFSLRAAANFGFAAQIGAPAFDGAMRLAFVTDDLRHQVAVVLRQDEQTGVLHGEVQSEDAGFEVDAVRAQVARILSLDHDGVAWTAVGERDPVIGRLQAAHPGVRPVLFHSPYEAAAWSIVSARRASAQAAKVRDALARQLGASFDDVAGVPMAAFPLPERLLACEEFPGLQSEKVARLHGIAEAALAGWLDPERLRAQAPDAALAELQTLKGIGPFYAQLVYVRASGVADVLSDEPHVLHSAARFYRLDGPPDPATFAELAEPWRPYRTWAMVLLRVAGG